MVDFHGPAVTPNLRGGERGRRVAGGEGADVGLLGGAARHKPDGAGKAEKMEGGGDAGDAQLRNKVWGHEEFVLFQGLGSGKEGGGMTVVADAEEDQVKLGRVAQICFEAFLVVPGADFGFADLGMDSFDLGSRSVEGLVDHAVVAVLVIRRNPALISQIKVGGGPGPGQLGQSLIEGFGGGTSGEGNRKGAPGLEGGPSQRFPAGHHGLHPGRGVDKLMQSHPETMPKTL